MSGKSLMKSSNGKRNSPPVKAELPPRSDLGAFSSTSTLQPSSRADSPAASAALPAPTTITSGIVEKGTEFLPDFRPQLGAGAGDWRERLQPFPGAAGIDDHAGVEGADVGRVGHRIEGAGLHAV